MLAYLRHTFFGANEEKIAMHHRTQDGQSAQLEALRARTRATIQESKAFRQKYACTTEGSVNRHSVVPVTNLSLAK